MGQAQSRTTSRTEKPKRIIMWYFDWEYLVPSGIPGEDDLDQLKAWLRSQTTNSDTMFTRTNHSVKSLRVALQSAIWEISFNLDSLLEQWVAQAAAHNVQATVSEFFATRDIDWNGITDADVDAMQEGKCIDMLHAARDEVAWLVHELSRLARWTYVEEELEAAGEDSRRKIITPAARKRRSSAARE